LILIILNSIGLLIVGVKYAIMFGILSALMNIIPYFGTLIGAAIPLSYTLLSGEPEKALGVLILFAIIQFTENNILTPNITGGSVQINPFFTILSIVLGGMVWGIPGMLVSVPLMGAIKIIFENIEPLHPYAYLIGIQKQRKFIKLRTLAKKRIDKKKTKS
jgi:predicted PurR-regulated permease PerM